MWNIEDKFYFVLLNFCDGVENAWREMLEISFLLCMELNRRLRIQ